jgi:maleate isomerase/arylmalonate decarboxylase
MDVLAPYSVYGWRAKIGLIVPPTNTVNEGEWQRVMPEGVTFHVTRMPLHAGHDDAKLYADLDRAVDDLAAANVDVIAYGCTAGSMVAPLTRLTDHMTQRAGRPGVATAPALVQALQELRVRRVAMATPYHAALNAHEVQFLAQNQITVVAEKGLGFGANGPAEYRYIARVPPELVYRHARAVDRDDAEAILISCTDFATLTVTERLEQELGKPVITSNQATLWAALRAAGLRDRIAGWGRLLSAH